MTISSHKELMQWELAMQVLADFLDTLWVSGLGEVGIEPAWITVQQILATTQVLPGSCPHRRWNALTTTLFHLQHQVTVGY